MLRKLLYLFLLLAFFAGWFAWARRVPLASRFLTEQLGIPTKISDLEISTHGVILRNVQIAATDSVFNPALQINRLRIQVSPLQFLYNPIVISEMELENVTIALHLSGWGWGDSDWDVLLRRFMKQTQGKKSGSSSEEDVKRYVVRRLIVSDVRLARSPEEKKLTLLDYFDLRDVGRSDPHYLPGIAYTILSAVAQQAAELQPALKGVASRVWRSADNQLRAHLRSLQEEQKVEKEKPKKGFWNQAKALWQWINA